MCPIFAVVIDDGVVNWILTGLAVALPAIGTTIIMLWRKFIAWLAPRANGAFEAHTGLINQLKTQVPIVSETLSKLGETQDRQCQTLEQHGKLLEGHNTRLDELLTHVKAKSGNIAGENPQ